MGVFGNTENDNEASVSPPSLGRTTLKRSSSVDEDDDKAASASSSSSGGDASSGSDGDEETSLIRPPKRPLLNHKDDQADRNHSNSNSVTAPEGNSDKEGSNTVSIFDNFMFHSRQCLIASFILG